MPPVETSVTFVTARGCSSVLPIRRQKSASVRFKRRARKFAPSMLLPRRQKSRSARFKRRAHELGTGAAGMQLVRRRTSAPARFKRKVRKLTAAAPDMLLVRRQTSRPARLGRRARGRRSGQASRRTRRRAAGPRLEPAALSRRYALAQRWHGTPSAWSGGTGGPPPRADRPDPRHGHARCDAARELLAIPVSTPQRT